MKRSKAELRKIAYGMVVGIIENALNADNVHNYCADYLIEEKDEEYIEQVIVEIVQRLEKKA